MGRREYKGAATPTTIASTITNSATSLTITDATNWPTGVFSFVIDPGLAGEEKILATSRTGTTINITTRGYDNTSAANHNAGAITYPVPTAVDFDEANSHVNATTGVHGLSGAVVGTTDSQTLTNKTLTTPVATTGIVTPTFSGNAYTVASTDAGNLLLASNSTTAGTIYIPTDATYAFPTGTVINFIQTGTGQLSITAATPGTTTIYANPGAKIRAQYSMAQIIKTATNTWYLNGDLTA